MRDDWEQNQSHHIATPTAKPLNQFDSCNLCATNTTRGRVRATLKGHAASCRHASDFLALLRDVNILAESGA